MSKLKKFLLYWIPPLIWMGLIFSASADVNSFHHSSRFFLPLMHWLFPGLAPETLDGIHYVFRKCGHLTEFAILAVLFWRAIHSRQNKDARCWHWREALLALALVFAYAATDEWHQMFVPQRTGMISDVFVDTAGGAVGLLLLNLVGRLFKRW